MELEVCPQSVLCQSLKKSAHSYYQKLLALKVGPNFGQFFAESGCQMYQLCSHGRITWYALILTVA
jgi:hypothetical protein